tara:strand:- start:236 stop:415 length:180 start_codon:yes stop_codon:yes gene_type:complete
MVQIEQEIKRKCRELDLMHVWGIAGTPKYKRILKEVEELQIKYNKAKKIFNSNFNKYRR